MLFSTRKRGVAGERSRWETHPSPLRLDLNGTCGANPTPGELLAGTRFRLRLAPMTPDRFRTAVDHRAMQEFTIEAMTDRCEALLGLGQPTVTAAAHS